MAVLEALKQIGDLSVQAQTSLSDELDAKYKEGYDKGFADGKASVVLPDPNNPDKLYTQADMDRVAAQAKADQVAADQAAADKAAADLKAAQDALAALQQDVGAKIHDGIQAFKAQELEKLKGLEADFQE